MSFLLQPVLVDVIMKIQCSNHYLLHCPVFHVPRVKLLSSIRSVLPVNMTIDVDLLLYGSKNVCETKLTSIFQAVHEFIDETARL